MGFLIFLFVLVFYVCLSLLYLLFYNNLTLNESDDEYENLILMSFFYISQATHYSITIFFYYYYKACTFQGKDCAFFQTYNCL